jgi:DNA-binding beta-propeller fold protein YncE
MLGFSPLGKTTFADDTYYPFGLPPLNLIKVPVQGDIATADNGSQYIFSGAKWQVYSKTYSYKGAALENVSNITSFDLSSGNFFDVSLTQASTFIFTNPPTTDLAQKFQVKFNIAATENTVNGYALSAATYDNASFSIGAQTGLPQDVTFSPDGTKMYVISSSPDAVFQYTLSIGFDITTATFDLSRNLFGAPIYEGNPMGLTFSTDGTRMFTVGQDAKEVVQFDLSTPFDIATATWNGVDFKIGSQDPSPAALVFSPDGNNLYIVGAYPNYKIHQYILTTAFDLTSASYSGSGFLVLAQESQAGSIAISNDGTKIFIAGAGNDTVFQYNMLTPFDISTASYSGISFIVGAQDSLPTGLFIRDDGTKLYIIGMTGDTVYQYSSFESILFSVSWPTSILWESGSAPTLPDLGETDILEFYTSDGGVTYYGKLKEDNVS